MYSWIRQGRAAIVATIECALQSEAMLGLIVRNALGRIKLGQSGFDFSQKYEPFNGIVDGGIWWHRQESLDNAVAGKWLLHGPIVKHILRWAKRLTICHPEQSEGSVQLRLFPG